MKSINAQRVKLANPFKIKASTEMFQKCIEMFLRTVNTRQNTMAETRRQATSFRYLTCKVMRSRCEREQNTSRHEAWVPECAGCDDCRGSLRRDPEKFRARTARI